MKPVLAKQAAPKVAANMTVSLDHIVNAKDFPYRDVDPAHVDSLVADIAANGLDTPLFVFSTEPNQQIKLKGSDKTQPAHFLAAGQHRREALKKLRRENPKAFEKHFANGIPVVHRVGTAQEMMFLMLRENVQRKEMSAEQIFPVLELLTKEPHNLTGKEIAVKIGKSTAWVSQHLAVLETDPELAEAAKSGKVSVSDARTIAADARKDAKSNGGKVDTKAVSSKIAAAAQKKTNQAAAGNVRAAGDDRRVSAKKLYQRVLALPNLTLQRHRDVLLEALAYLAGESDKLPAELKKDAKPATPKVTVKAKAPAPAAKPAAKK